MDVVRESVDFERMQSLRECRLRENVTTSSGCCEEECRLWENVATFTDVVRESVVWAALARIRPWF